MPKSLIVNADDFGQSPGVNRGILYAHKNGIVTSASVLVRWPAAVELANAITGYPSLSFGLHIDLGEWSSRDGEWYPIYRVLSESDERSPIAVRAEVERQVLTYRQLAGKNPTHLDSHQHVHKTEPLRSILIDIGQTLGIPVRHFDLNVRYVGDFYGQTNGGSAYPEGISVHSLANVIKSLGDGLSELCCHPALGVDHDSPYAAEREQELVTLCDRSIMASLAECNVRLANRGEAPIPPAL